MLCSQSLQPSPTFRRLVWDKLESGRKLLPPRPENSTTGSQKRGAVTADDEALVLALLGLPGDNEAALELWLFLGPH